MERTVAIIGEEWKRRTKKRHLGRKIGRVEGIDDCVGRKVLEQDKGDEGGREKRRGPEGSEIDARIVGASAKRKKRKKKKRKKKKRKEKESKKEDGENEEEAEGK